MSSGHLLGVASHLYRGSPAAVAALCRAQGLRCVQLTPAFPGLPFREPGQITPERCRRAAEPFQDAGLTIACLSGSTNLLDPDLDRRPAGIVRLHALLRHCRAFGAERLVTETGSPNPASPWTPETWVELGLILKEALRIAADHGPDGLNGGQSASSGGAVVRFSVSNTQGTLSYAGTSTTVATGLIQPSGMTFGTASGDTHDLYVSNSGAQDVVKIVNADGTPQTPSTFVAAGSGSLNFPAGLTWGSDGKLYVVDLGATSNNGNVLRYTSTGAFDEVFTQPTGTLTFQFPSDALFDPQGHLLTANLGPAYPPTLQGSVFQFGSDGTYLKTLVSSSQFPNTGPGSSGISPSQLALLPTRASPQPTITTDTGLTVHEGATGNIGQTNLEATESGVAATQLTYTVTTSPAHGTLLRNNLSTTSFTQADINNGLISYRNNGGKAASDTFSFTVSDGSNSTGPNVFDITVNLQPPTVSTNNGLTATEGATTVLHSTNLQASESGFTASQLTYTVTAAPSHGVLLVNGVVATSFTQADINAADVAYQNDGSKATSDSFSFTVSDGTNSTTTNNFSITVNLQPPVVTSNNGATVAGGDSVTLSQSELQASESGFTASQLTYTVTAAPSHGSLLDNGVATTSFTQADINNGLVSYQNDGTKSSMDSFSFTVSDGTNSTTPNNFNITVDLPPPDVTTDTGLTLPQGGTAVIGPGQLDTTDPGAAPSQLTYTVTTRPAHGFLVKNGVSTTSFTQDDVNNGFIAYRNDGSSNTSDSFSFTVFDGGATSSAQTFSIAITLPSSTSGSTTSVTTAAPRAIQAVLLSVRRKHKPALLEIEVLYADNGQVKSVLMSPVQNRPHRHITVNAVDTNGDGVNDAVKLTSQDGRKVTDFILQV